MSTEDEVDTTPPGPSTEVDLKNAEIENQLPKCNNGKTTTNIFYTNTDLTITAESNVSSWTSHTSQQLKTPISTPLLSTIPKRSKLNNALNSWVYSKKESSDNDTKLKIEKHTQQMLFMQEEHNLKITHMQEQQDQDMRIKEERHALQKAILQQELLNLKK